jgi:hypothetical protein
MRKLTILGFGLLLLMTVSQVSRAQSEPYTPAKGSPERKAILDAVRKYRKAPNEVYIPSGFWIIEGWAYVSAPNPNDPDIDTEAFEYIVRKTRGAWRVVDQVSHVEGTDYKKERRRIKRRFPSLPMAIFPDLASDG